MTEPDSRKGDVGSEAQGGGELSEDQDVSNLDPDEALTADADPNADQADPPTEEAEVTDPADPNFVEPGTDYPVEEQP